MQFPDISRSSSIFIISAEHVIYLFDKKLFLYTTAFFMKVKLRLAERRFETKPMEASMTSTKNKI